LAKAVINWDSSQSYVISNPKRPVLHNTSALDKLFPGHIWMQTSGSTGEPRWVALSKMALLISARSVNDHLGISAKDIWLNPIPNFHVGGLSIHARAEAGGFKAVDANRSKWSPKSFEDALKSVKATLTSLVPTQVFDLVHNRIPSPEQLRIAVVGGGRLHPFLYDKARELGWPLYRSYGMTECSSQIATSKSESDSDLRILGHVQAKIVNRRLALCSESLLTAYAAFENENWKVWDPKEDGWFVTDDFAEISEGNIVPLGRATDQVKISGVLVSLAALEEKVSQVAHDIRLNLKFKLAAIPHERWENQIILLGEKLNERDLRDLAEAYNSRVHPKEQIQSVRSVEHLPSKGFA